MDSGKAREIRIWEVCVDKKVSDRSGCEMVNLSRAQVWNGQPDNTWSGDSGTRGKGLTIDEDAKVNGLIPKVK